MHPSWPISLLMKGREDDRPMLEQGIQLNVMALLDSTELNVERLAAIMDLAVSDNRDKILKAHTSGRAKGIQAEDFLNLPTTKEGAELIKELDAILRKIISLKGIQAVITADHGLVFQQEPVDANDRSEFPVAKELSFKNRRFSLGNGIKPSAGQKLFIASELGLDRYPRSGSGSRFVHGGNARTRASRWRPSCCGCPPRSPWAS